MPVVVYILVISCKIVLEIIEFVSENPMVIKFVIALAAWEISSTIKNPGCPIFKY